MVQGNPACCERRPWGMCAAACAGNWYAASAAMQRLRVHFEGLGVKIY